MSTLADATITAVGLAAVVGVIVVRTVWIVRAWATRARADWVERERFAAALGSFVEGPRR